MRRFGRAALLAGLALFGRAAYTIIAGRHEQRQAGGHPEDYDLPWSVVVEVIVAGLALLVGGTKSFGSLHRIYSYQEKRPSWDYLRSRPNFRLYRTRAACASSLIANFVVPPPAAPLRSS